MAFGTLEVTIGLVCLFTWCYYKFFISNHWKKFGIPGPEHIPFLGNFPAALFGRESIVESVQKIYDEWKKEPFFGVFLGPSPVLVINDLELVKTVLIKDFAIFPGRGVHIPENDDSVSSNIFNLQGHRWKVLRSKLTPIFTSGKLKHMLKLIAECAEHFEQYLLEEVKKNDVIELKEAAAKYGTDVIGSCAFGINTNAMSGEDSEFRKFGREFFASTGTNRIRKIIRESLPSLTALLARQRPRNLDFFVDSVRKTMEYRDKENVVRADLIDVLRDIKEKKNEIDIKLTDNILTAQAFIFFLAGFETSATTISFVMHELALNPEYQIKLRKEIRECINKHGEKWDSEVFKEMKLLDFVIKESLRKNSPASSLRRESIAPWRIPGTNITLPANTLIYIPIHSFHHDPEYFPNPDVFDPYRFDDERKSEIIPGTYLPFGSGPKNCLGERFGFYQTKLGIIKILKNFEIKPSEFTKKHFEIDKASLIFTIEGGFPLKLVHCEC